MGSGAIGRCLRLGASARILSLYLLTQPAIPPDRLGFAAHVYPAADAEMPSVDPGADFPAFRPLARERDRHPHLALKHDDVRVLEVGVGRVGPFEVPRQGRV